MLISLETSGCKTIFTWNSPIFFIIDFKITSLALTTVSSIFISLAISLEVTDPKSAPCSLASLIIFIVFGIFFSFSVAILIFSSLILTSSSLFCSKNFLFSGEIWSYPQSIKRKYIF